MTKDEDEGRGLTGAITESLTTFTVFLRNTLTSLLTRLLFTILQETLVHWEH